MTRSVALVLLAACVKPAAPRDAADIESLNAKIADLERQLEAAPKPPPPLPASLPTIYPPQSDTPELLFGMYDVSDHMVAIGLALQRNDPEAAKAEYEGFKEAYLRIGEIVPEWKGGFVEERIAPLGAALASGDPDAVGAAFGEIGQMCSGCHQTFMVRAHHALHWGDFRQIEVARADGSKISWHDLMYVIDGALVGITWHAEAGRPDDAAAAVDQLKAGMQALGTACETCHDTERHYYVDPKTLATLDPIRAGLSDDPAKTRERVLEFRRGTCEKCHHVHIPAHFGHLAAEE